MIYLNSIQSDQSKKICTDRLLPQPRVGGTQGRGWWEIFKSGKHSWSGYIQVLEIIRSGQGSKGWTAETKEKSREYAFIRDEYM